MHLHNPWHRKNIKAQEIAYQPEFKPGTLLMESSFIIISTSTKKNIKKIKKICRGTGLVIGIRVSADLLHSTLPSCIHAKNVYVW
jgi:hypothetical protein